MKTKSYLKAQNCILNWFNDKEHICWIILVVGLLLRMIYAVQVSYDYSPHDLGTFSADGITDYGHLSYIHYLYLYKSIPTTYLGQFYHPPLFHIIGAVMLAMNHMTGNYSTALENLQMLNMFFATIGVVYGYRILKKIGKNDWSIVTGTVFLSFCPAFYIIGAELNNDCLATMFQIMALFYTLCWVEKQNAGNILKIALCIGLSMLTKTNGALIAFAVGLTFLYMLIINRNEWKSYFKQFIIFGIVCVPLGLCWNIYRSLKYGVSLNYIAEIPVDSGQYIGDIPMLTRLGLPSVRQLTSNAISWEHSADFSNIWGQTFLTMNFDEGLLHIDGGIWRILAHLLLWLSIFLSLLLLVALLRSLCSSKTDVSYKILFPINFLMIYGFFIKFAFDYPQICTMNFRYIVIIHILLIGGYVHSYKMNLSGGFLNKCIGSCIVVQSVLATCLYLFCAV